MNDITIVSAFFSFKKNKYNSHDIYKFWGSNLFPNLNTNVVIFTDEENYDFICSLRTNELKEKTRIIKMKIEDFYMYKYIDYLDKNTPELYMFFNEKINFVKKAIVSNFFNSSYYAWCDFGCVRNSIYPELYLTNFPNLTNLTKYKIYMFKNDYEFSEEDYKEPYNDINGTIYSSSINPVSIDSSGNIYLTQNSALILTNLYIVVTATNSSGSYTVNSNFF